MPQNSQSWIIWGLLIALGVIVLFRFMLVFRFLLILFAGLGLVAWAIYAFRRSWLQQRQRKQFMESPEGMTQAKIAACQQQIAHLKTEIQDLQKEREELSDKIASASSASAAAKEESKKLIQTFTGEIELRAAKIDFLEKCVVQLRQMLHNYQLSETILQKKALLEKQKEADLESIGDLEELRTQIEYQRQYFQTLDELSNRLDKSHSTSHLKILQKELHDLSENIQKKDLPGYP